MTVSYIPRRGTLTKESGRKAKLSMREIRYLKTNEYFDIIRQSFTFFTKNSKSRNKLRDKLKPGLFHSRVRGKVLCHGRAKEKESQETP